MNVEKAHKGKKNLLFGKLFLCKCVIFCKNSCVCCENIVILRSKIKTLMVSCGGSRRKHNREAGETPALSRSRKSHELSLGNLRLSLSGSVRWEGTRQGRRAGRPAVMVIG